MIYAVDRYNVEYAEVSAIVDSRLSFINQVNQSQLLMQYRLQVGQRRQLDLANSKMIGHMPFTTG